MRHRKTAKNGLNNKNTIELELKGSDLNGVFIWLGNRDSNPNKQSQSLSCYRYTIPQNLQHDYYITFFKKVKLFVKYFYLY